jgi:Fe-S-cluster containining protein
MNAMDSYNGLKQMVPQAVCLTCDVCCRFPEETSFLAPFFMRDEIARLGSAALSHFDRPQQGSKIKLAHRGDGGDGCICPYFDPVTQYCGIYGDRPLDCRIYPFALLRNPEGAIVLGVDTKCPYIQEHAGDAQMGQDAEAVAQFLESEAITTLLAAHPALIGPFQDDVIILRPLEKLHAALST